MALALAALAACNFHPPGGERDVPPAESGAAAPAGAVLIFVDGAPVARAALEALRSPVPLASFLDGPLADPDAWARVRVARSSGSSSELPRNGAAPQQDLMLYLDANGRPSIGSFARPESVELWPELARSPRLAVPGIREVRIATTASEDAAPPPDDLVVQVGDASTALSPADFAALPRAAAPGGPRDRRLADLVAMRVALADVARVTLVGDGGAQLSLSGGALRGSGRALLIKRNRRGAYRFSEWTLGGSAPRRSQTLEAVRRIQIAPRAP